MLANLEDGPVTRKTLELCEAILKQPDFQLLREQVDAFMADAQIQRQYEELSEQGTMLQHKQQMGGLVDAAEINSFEEKREAFLKNPVARGFLDAQQLMHDVRETVARHVSKTFELGRLPQREDFEHGCGHGCSCSH
jgi:cell fate (sporulation/competence/biofilm development) regulator YlbF (YheA/YmcA/DUF963 family)